MSLSKFEIFLKSLNAHPVLNPNLSTLDFLPLDLSINNTELQTINLDSSDTLGVYIFNDIKNKNAKVAFGGYLEHRSIYQRSAYFNKSNPKTERNIHLGLDLWVEETSPIYAPLDGEIHSFKNNTNHGDYGPTLILKHTIKNQIFYTLYGHLSLESLVEKKVGMKVKKGKHIATLGSAEVNGDYPPHLHFQVIKNIQNYKGDYPGVSNQLDLEFYRANCPNPNLLLKL